MYYWDIKSLAREIDENQLSEWQKTKYIIALCILAILQSLLHSIIPDSGLNLLFLLSAFLTLAVVILGTIWLFNLHQRSSGERFIEKFVLLTFPANIRFQVLSLVVSVLSWQSFFRAMPMSIQYSVYVLSLPALYAYFFYAMGKGFAIKSEIRN